MESTEEPGRAAAGAVGRGAGWTAAWGTGRGAAGREAASCDGDAWEQAELALAGRTCQGGAVAGRMAWPDYCAAARRVACLGA